jgi:ABC-type transport system involved in multi-copper enzyme maturation permease subunit
MFGDVDGTTLLLGLVFSGIGFVAFRYGRSQERVPAVVLGFALMFFPLCVSGALWTAIIGASLTTGLWLWRD